MKILWKLYASKNTTSNDRLYVFLNILNLDEVKTGLGLSPVNIFVILTPLSLRSPFPSDILLSIIGA